MLRVDTSKFKKTIQPNPGEIMEKLKNILPAHLKQRMMDIKEWVTK